MSTEQSGNGDNRVVIGTLFEGPRSIIHTLDFKVPETGTDSAIHEDPQEVGWRVALDQWVHGDISYKQLMEHFPLEGIALMWRQIQTIVGGVLSKTEKVKNGEVVE